MSDIQYHDETQHHFTEWVRLNREANGLPLVQGQGPPGKLILNYGRWLWVCECNTAYLLPRQGEVACVYCEDAQWREVDREKIAEIEELMHPMPRSEMHWEDE